MAGTALATAALRVDTHRESHTAAIRLDTVTATAVRREIDQTARPRTVTMRRGIVMAILAATSTIPCIRTSRQAMGGSGYLTRNLTRIMGNRCLTTGISLTIPSTVLRFTAMSPS